MCRGSEPAAFDRADLLDESAKQFVGFLCPGSLAFTCNVTHTAAHAQRETATFQGGSCGKTPTNTHEEARELWHNGTDIWPFRAAHADNCNDSASSGNYRCICATGTHALACIGCAVAMPCRDIARPAHTIRAALKPPAKWARACALCAPGPCRATPMHTD